MIFGIHYQDPGNGSCRLDNAIDKTLTSLFCIKLLSEPLPHIEITTAMRSSLADKTTDWFTIGSYLHRLTGCHCRTEFTKGFSKLGNASSLCPIR